MNSTKRPIVVKLAVALSVLLVTACSSGTDPIVVTDANMDNDSGIDVDSIPPFEPPAPITGPVQALPTVDFAAKLFVVEEQTATAIESYAQAQFYRLTTPLDTPPFLRERSALDLCEIGSEASQINAENLNFPIDHMLNTADASVLQVANIIAGQSVELNSNDGSYVSLEQGPDELSYEPPLAADMNMTVPSALNVSVLGDEFPGLTWQWEKSAPISAELRSAVRSVADNAQLSWTGLEQTTAQHSWLYLYAAHINELTGEYQSFTCELADDGEFTLPANIQSLYSNGFSAQFVEMARYTRSLQTISDVSIVNVFMQKL